MELTESPTEDIAADPLDGVTFDLPGDDALPAIPLHAYDRDVNIASQLSADEQAAIMKEALAKYERDWDSGKDFRARRVRQVELFAGIMPAKEPGHEKIAQIHLSIIAQSVLILHATIHGQLFPPTNYIYGARAVTPAANDRVRRLGLHMNWQVTTRILEYLPANDRGMMQWLIYGTAFDCWYYDPIEQRPCYEFIHTDDLVMPYACKSVRYDLADVPRLTRKLRKYQHEIEALRDADGFYVNVEKLFPEDDTEAETMQPSERESDDRRPMTKSQDKVQGQSPTADDPNGPRLLIEQHTWLRLPGEKKQRPVIITGDVDTGTMMRLVLREDEDPRDRARFNREQAANDARAAALMAQHQSDVADHAATIQAAMNPGPIVDEMGQPVIDQATGAPQALPMPNPEDLPPAPVTPEMPAPPKPVRIVPVNWFTKYGCIPNPEGIYDFGVGYLLEGDNIAADTLMSQYVSALTLSLFPTVLYAKQAKLGRGDFVLRLGEAQPIDLPPELLSKAFFQMQFPPPPNAVQKLIEGREESGRALVGASNILTGESGEANETATGIQLRTNAARMNLAEMGNRYNQARANSMKNLARVNAKTMDPEEYFAVTMPGTMNVPPEEMKIAREDYLEDFQVTFTCDPRLASQPQRVQDALTVLNQALAIPPGPLNPQAHAAVIKMAFVGYLRALERDDMANLVEQSPDMPPPMAPGQGGPPQPGGSHGRPGEKGPAPGPGAPGSVPGPQPGPAEGVGEPAGDAAFPVAA